jgi:DNA repair protein RecO (recombination protein O)
VASPARKAPNAPLAAYVLHSYDWSETSLIVELFTRERGRIAVAAKGAKRPFSQLRAVLLPFQRIAVLLPRSAGEDRAEVHTLRSAEWGGGTAALAGGALFRGFYANELLLKLLARDDPHPRLWDAYAATLPALGGDEAAAAAALRGFELLLLRETGVLPALDHVTATLAPLEPAGRYGLAGEAGLAAGGPDAVEGRVWTLLQAALEADDLGALQAVCRTAPGPLRAQLRGLLQYHLGPVPLRTRQVMLEVQRLGEPPR